MLVPERQPRAIPEQTAQVARLAFPNGNRLFALRDELAVVYEDEEFRALFATAGRPAESPGQLALVVVLQYVERLTDQQAAEAVRGRLDWKYLLGLELTDPGFDGSLLSRFRERLVAGSAEWVLLESLLERCRGRGLVKPRGRQRVDATHMLMAVRELNRLELLGETLRAALNALATVAPSWLSALAPPAWYERYAARTEQSRLPESRAEQGRLALAIGQDGMALLEAAHAPGAPAYLREVEAVEILRRVWVQQYATEGDRLRLRVSGELPPPSRLIRTPFDTEARWSEKRSTEWVGYKVHLNEHCDPDRPHLINYAEVTPATTPDQKVTAALQQAQATRDRLPAEQLADSAYVDARNLVRGRRDYEVRLVGRVSADTSWQARAGAGYAAAAFRVDWAARAAHCPQGKASVSWSVAQRGSEQEVIHVRFAAEDCGPCPARARCTRAKTGVRSLHLQPQAEQEALARAREWQTTEEFRALYAQRAGIEGTLSAGVRAHGLRRSRYAGIAKTRLAATLTAVAINLNRLGDWWLGKPRAQTRVSRFAALAPTG